MQTCVPCDTDGICCLGSRVQARVQAGESMGQIQEVGTAQGQLGGLEYYRVLR